VDHLVVGEREDEIFMEGVKEGKGQFVHVETAMDRIFGDKGEHVVHPAHIPLVHKT